MTLKKDLANRVRGWIPKEPNLTALYLAVFLLNSTCFRSFFQ
jgi:hypothetical protein